MEVPDIVPATDQDGVDTRNLETRDPGGDPSFPIPTKTHIYPSPDGGESNKDTAAGDACDTPVPNKVTRKRTHNTSRSPDKTHKKIIDENGTIRKIGDSVMNL